MASQILCIVNFRHMKNKWIVGVDIYDVVVGSALSSLETSNEIKLYHEYLKYNKHHNKLNNLDR